MAGPDERDIVRLRFRMDKAPPKEKVDEHECAIGLELAAPDPLDRLRTRADSDPCRVSACALSEHTPIVPCLTSDTVQR